MRPGRHFWFGAVCVGISILVALAAIEAISSFFSPPWPARALRPMESVSGQYNSWGMWDKERSFAHLDGVPRSVLVGDSFLEHGLLPQNLPAAVEERFAEARHPAEAINLGVSGTGPISYYYRIRDVALPLAPDALALFFYAGNDFLLADQGFASDLLPPLIDESPGRSLLGWIMPRTNWLLVNRLRAAEVLRSNKPIEGEPAMLQQIVQGPRELRLQRLAQHMKRYYFPEVPEERLAEILSRGDERLIDLFDPARPDHELLMGWLPNLIIRAELNPNSFTSIHTVAEAEPFVLKGDIDATLSWLVQSHELARSHNVPLHVFIIPASTVDPQFEAFWRPWPHYYSWYLHCEARQQHLVKALAEAKVPFTDLGSAFAGLAGTYRKSDAHWSQRGLGIAADKVYARLGEILKGAGRVSPPSAKVD